MDQETEFLAAMASAGGEGSMWEIGEGLGLDRGQAEAVGTELMGRGLLEMVSLSGKVRLTDAGRDALPGLAGGGGGGGDLAGWVAEVKAQASPKGDLAADLACLEAQTGRSQPLAAVVTACLDAAAQALDASHPELAAQARKLMG